MAGLLATGAGQARCRPFIGGERRRLSRNVESVAEVEFLPQCGITDTLCAGSWRSAAGAHRCGAGSELRRGQGLSAGLRGRRASTLESNPRCGPPDNPLSDSRIRRRGWHGQSRVPSSTRPGDAQVTPRLCSEVLRAAPTSRNPLPTDDVSARKATGDCGGDQRRSKRRVLRGCIGCGGRLRVGQWWSLPPLHALAKSDGRDR